MGLEVLDSEFSDADWRRRPSWYLVATEDRMIQPLGAVLIARAARLARQAATVYVTLAAGEAAA